jgi:hypothetical protein
MLISLLGLGRSFTTEGYVMGVMDYIKSEQKIVGLVALITTLSLALIAYLVVLYLKVA